MADGSMSVNLSSVFKSIKVERIPWEECGRIVEQANHSRQRYRSPNVFTPYRKDVEAEKWVTTHQSIAFTPEGICIDGQNRLWAHYLAERDFVGVVSRYATTEAAEAALPYIDTGKVRSVSDGGVMSGVMDKDKADKKVAITNLMLILMRGQSKAVSRSDVYDFYGDHRSAIDWSAALPFKNAMLPAALAIAWLCAPGDTEEFAHRVTQGVGNEGSCEAWWNKAVKDGLLHTIGGGKPRIDVCWRALRILKSHLRRERAVSRLNTTPESLSWFLQKLRAGGVRVVLLDERCGPESGQ